MRFILIDKVVSLEAGEQIKAVKNVSLSEEYLADHFPTFPVLPGVLLLEGLIESASWLVRQTENFAHSMILLEQARNVKYKSFLGARFPDRIYGQSQDYRRKRQQLLRHWYVGRRENYRGTVRLEAF